MDFDLSPDQVALREAAAALLDRYASDEALRKWVGPGTVVGTLPGTEADALAGDAPAGYDESLWQAMVEQGWPAVERPEEAGGLGLGMVEVAVLSEQVGRHVAPAPFLPSVLAAGALAEASAGEDVTALAERLVEGEAIGALGWPSQRLRVEPDAASASVPAVRLSGEVDPVVYGPSAEVVVLPVLPAPDGGAAAGRPGLYAVVLDPSQRPAPEPAMDRTRELGWVRLSGTPAWQLGDGPAAERLVNRAVTALSAELLGAAERSLELAVEYAKERVQFGKPIGSFQAVKHRLADALVDVEGMRSTVYYAAWCVSVEHPDASLAASMAKAWCSDASARVLAASLQVHGGIGFTWEHVLHLYLKRSQLDQVSFGDAAWHRERVAALLRQRLDHGDGIF